ncbi:MAG: ComF family protein [Clostridiales bacterium]|nr:ComF family protein [Clostridiales bacterium]
MANAFLDYIIELLYPVRCPFCTEIVIPKGERVCAGCKEKLPYINEPRCMKCSKPISNDREEYCSDCARKNHQYNRGFAVWRYDETMKRSIADFKYRSRKDNARFYVSEIIRLYGDKIKEISPDVIVPIPLHRSKYNERGYNQAQLLALPIGKELGIPVLPRLLLRKKKTLPQKNLSDKERLKNLTEAFGYNERLAVEYKKQIKKVLLVDDIYTTGSTIEACTHVLKSNGVLEVFFLVLCIGEGF